jgi:RNA polymerase sigma factor (TIGR02999 family)
MSDVTRILSQIEEGDGKGAEQLLPLVYDELRKLAAQKMAQEAPGQTLQATALVHEAYIRLVDVDAAKHWESRRHFLACAAEAMRRILVDHARQQLGLKRGGGNAREHVDPEELADSAPPDEVVAVHDALDALASEDSMAAEVVRLRYFGGFSMDQIAEILGASRATAFRLWTFARAWLRSSLMESGAGSESSHF